MAIGKGTGKKQRCRKANVFPCKTRCVPRYNSRSGKEQRCQNVAEGTPSTYLEWAKQQGQRKKAINAKRKARGETLFKTDKFGGLINPDKTKDGKLPETYRKKAKQARAIGEKSKDPKIKKLAEKTAQKAELVAEKAELLNQEKKVSATIDDYTSGRIPVPPREDWQGYNSIKVALGTTKTENDGNIKTVVSLVLQPGDTLTCKIDFDVNGSYDKNKLSPRSAFMVGRQVFNDAKNLVKGLPNGTIISCEAYSGDGHGEYRRRIYEKMGFDAHTKNHDKNNDTSRDMMMTGVVMDGRLLKMPQDVYEYIENTYNGRKK